jgi:lipoprotein-anchoring transpeptidase ErfK/SrfK
VGVRKIVVGLSAVVAAGALAACSSGGVDSAAPVTVIGITTSQTVVTSTSDITTAPKTTTPSVTRTTPAPTPAKKKTPVVRTVTKVAGVPCSAAARACVDLSARKAWLVSGGKIVYGPMSIMPGRVNFPTPKGTFHVLFKDANYFSREFQAPMPDSVFFVPGIAFHVGSLHVYSHGCVHLAPTSASKFFHTLHTGDEVQVVA